MRHSDQYLEQLIRRYGIHERIPLTNGVEDHWVVRAPLLMPEDVPSAYDTLLIIWKTKSGRYAYFQNVISRDYNLVLHSQLLQDVENLTGASPKTFWARGYLYAVVPYDEHFLVVENSYGKYKALKIHLYGKEERNGKVIVFPIFHNLVRRTHREYEERRLPLREELDEAIGKVGEKIVPLLEKKVSIRRLYRLLGDVRTVYRITREGKAETKDYPIGKVLVEAIRREYGNLPRLKDVLIFVSDRIAKKETGLTQQIRRKIRNRLGYLIDEVVALSYKGVTPIVL